MLIQSRTTTINNNNWHSFAKRIASPADPTENSPAAVERLVEKLLPYIVDVKGVRPQFHPRNSVQLVDFQSKWARDYYYSAEERFLEESAKLASLKGQGQNTGMMMLAIFNAYRMAAEFVKAEPQVDLAYDLVNNQGKAAVIVCNFQKTIAKGVQLFKQKYNVPRNKISLIWGGSQQFAQKERLSETDIQTLLSKLKRMEEIEPALLQKFVWQMKNDDSGFGEELKELDLGSQSRKDRQREIDRFQSGESLYCFYTFKSGGVGLSLHHTDEFTKQKVRRKESGYACEEDIPLIPTRQRGTFLSPTYSAIEMVQGLGRVPRLTSLSDTQQAILFYRGTIEERVAMIVSMKLKCLKKVIRQREHWEDAIFIRDANVQEDSREKEAIKLLTEGDAENGETEDIFLDEDEVEVETIN